MDSLIQYLQFIYGFIDKLNSRCFVQAKSQSLNYVLLLLKILQCVFLKNIHYLNSIFESV